MCKHTHMHTNALECQGFCVEVRGELWRVILDYVSWRVSSGCPACLANTCSLVSLVLHRALKEDKENYTEREGEVPVSIVCFLPYYCTISNDPLRVLYRVY